MLLPLVRALRPPQWVKNLFVLVPAVFAHRLLHGPALERALLAFAAFCAASSAVYLLNDLRDREADRQHPLKRHRPLAAGTLAPGPALAVALLLAVGALASGVLLGAAFAAVVGLYLLLNLAYSWGLKHVVILDVMIVAIGFELRVEGGAAAIGVAVSSWLLLCTLFLALFLAFSKRRHELETLADGAAVQRRVLSNYSAPFLDQMINVVSASAVVSYAFYATAEETVSQHGRGLVYTVPFVLFGVFRYLYLIYQDSGPRNPTETLLTDPPFLLNLLLWGLAVLWVLYVR